VAKQEIPNDGSSPGKKPYTGPRLEVYGDLRGITQTVGKKGTLDGGASMTDHTKQ
jgi:hypothetical protein